MLLWKRYGNNKMAAILHLQQYSRRLNFLFIYFFPDQRLYAVTSQRLYMNYRRYQIILQVKHFLQKSGAVGSVDCIFIIWVGQPGGDNGQKVCNSHLFKQEVVVAAPSTSTLSALL